MDRDDLVESACTERGPDNIGQAAYREPDVTVVHSLRGYEHGPKTGAAEVDELLEAQDHRTVTVLGGASDGLHDLPDVGAVYSSLHAHGQNTVLPFGAHIHRADLNCWSRPWHTSCKQLAPFSPTVGAFIGFAPSLVLLDQVGPPVGHAYHHDGASDPPAAAIAARELEQEADLVHRHPLSGRRISAVNPARRHEEQRVDQLST